jgi:hypothetical protein
VPDKCLSNSIGEQVPKRQRNYGRLDCTSDTSENRGRKIIPARLLAGFFFGLHIAPSRALAAAFDLGGDPRLDVGFKPSDSTLSNAERPWEGAIRDSLVNSAARKPRKRLNLPTTQDA